MPNPIMNKTFNVQAKLLNSTDGELMLYGDVADERWYDGEQVVVPVEVDTELKKLGDVSNLTVRINSYGGSVTAGNAIISMITAKKKKKCKVTTVIEGIAASMGSAIAMCGDEIIMYENALTMAHKPSSFVWGNVDDMAKAIETLNKCEDTLVVNYMHHFKGTEDELRNLLKEEKWLTANEALEYGLCTKVEGEVKIAASANGFIFNKVEIPKEILEKIKDKIQINDKGGEEDMFNKEQQTQIKAFLSSEHSAMISQNDKGEFAISGVCETVLDGVEVFLTADVVKAKAGKEMTADEVLAMFDTVSQQAQKIASFDTEKALLVNKATAFDEIKNKAIEKALLSGVKAKADNFDKERWNKVFDSFSIDEIQAQSTEWDNEAKIVLNAGKHFSSQGGKEPKTEEFNTEDYQL